MSITQGYLLMTNGIVRCHSSLVNKLNTESVSDPIFGIKGGRDKTWGRPCGVGHGLPVVNFLKTKAKMKAKSKTKLYVQIPVIIPRDAHILFFSGGW